MSNYLLFFLMVLLNSGSCETKFQDEENFLNIMASTLNKNIPKYKRIYDEKGFYIDNGHPKGFFVYDLVDTDKNSYPTTKVITINKNGIYHFAPARYNLSFSHIAVIKDGKMKIFSYINCNKKGDNIDDVIEFIEKSNFKYNEAILEQVRNYRDYGMYFQTDPQSYIECK